jgi:hypothetical protein
MKQQYASSYLTAIETQNLFNLGNFGPHIVYKSRTVSDSIRPAGRQFDMPDLNESGPRNFFSEVVAIVFI